MLLLIPLSSAWGQHFIAPHSWLALMLFHMKACSVQFFWLFVLWDDGSLNFIAFWKRSDSQPCFYSCVVHFTFWFAAVVEMLDNQFGKRRQNTHLSLKFTHQSNIGAIHFISVQPQTGSPILLLSSDISFSRPPEFGESAFLLS